MHERQWVRGGMNPEPLSLRRKPVRIAAPLREQVLDLLRDEIVSGNILPGRRLIERELVDMTGTSRTTIREVIRHLVAEGLVVAVEPRGVAVATPTPKSIAELYEVRALLEGIIARDFVLHAAQHQVDNLSQSVEKIKAVEDDPIELLRTKDQFYELLSDGANNATARTLLEVLHTRIAITRGASLRAPGRTHESVAEIVALLDAIRVRDAVKASELAAVHVRRAATAALSQFRHIVSRSDESLNATTRRGNHADIVSRRVI